MNCSFSSTYLVRAQRCSAKRARYSWRACRAVASVLSYRRARGGASQLN